MSGEPETTPAPTVDDAKSAVKAAKAEAAKAVSAATPTASTRAPAKIRVSDSPPPRPGTPAAEPEVIAARDTVLAARAGLVSDVSRLEKKGRDTFDLRAQVSRIPARVAQDPRRAVAFVGAGIGAIAALRFLRGGGRKSQAGTLPIEVEEALAGMGADGKKMREVLDASFVKYLEAHGAVEGKKGGRIPTNLGLMLAPFVTSLARESLRRFLARRAAAGTDEASTPPSE